MTEIKAKKSGLEFEVPEGWRVVKLKDVAKITSGSTPLRGNLEYHRGGTIPWVKTTDLNNGEIIETEEKITPKALTETSLRMYPVGTVLVAMYGGFNQIGRTGILGIEATINQALSALSVKPEEVDPNFLISWLNAKVGEWKKLAGSSRKDPNITSKDVGDFPFFLIALPEQRAIAQVLGKMDEAIQTTERLIVQKELRKKWLMQHLLTGKMRLKGFGGEWKEVRFGSFLRESRIKGNTGVESKKITVKLYGKGVYAKEEKSIGSTNTQYFTRKSGQFIYSKLDFLNGAFGIIPDVLNGFESTLDLPCFDILDSKMNKFFLLYFVSREGFYKKYDDGAIGGRKAKRIQVNEFLNIKPKLPLLEEQTAIARVLQTADQEISLLKAKADKLREQKKGMMQVLLTGKVRLKLN